MSKIILCADQHIHPHSGSLSKMMECLEAFDWVYRVARERGIKYVVSLGDLFHDRQKLNTLAYHRTFDILKGAMDDGIKTYLLVGNHDMYHRESFEVHSLRPLTSVAEVIDRPQTMELEGLKADFLPFISNPEKILESKFPVQKRSRVLFGHLAVKGGILNKLWGTKYDKVIEGSLEERDDSEPDEIEQGVFLGYERVFLGHFHTRQSITSDARISYIGSPLQLTYSDALDTKGFDILDTETLETEFVENDFSPKYYILPYGEDFSKYDLGNSHVRVVVPSDMGNANILDLKKEVSESFGPATVEIVTTMTQSDQREIAEEALERSVVFTENKAETLKQYLNNVEVDEDLDKALLLRIGLEMSKSADN